MIFLCTLRFDLKEREAKELKRFFSLEKIEVAKEEKDKRPNDVKIDLISDTKELVDRSDNLIEIDNNGDNSDNNNSDTRPLLLESST
jgi:hypothetical protein